MNLLTDQLIRLETRSGQKSCSLPEVFAQLVADQIESFTALRAHQQPAWHMFLVQLGAIAMHRAGLSEPPTDTESWRTIICALTADEFPDDEPWRLVVDDPSRPAFLQPPVPPNIKWKDEDTTTPDGLDMLITSRNHDLKQAVAERAEYDDWIYALVSLQTCEGYGGPKNYGIGRMNGASSSRVLMGLAPMQVETGDDSVRSGPWFNRDVIQLVARRGELLDRFPIGYPDSGGLALTWIEAWSEGTQLQLPELDIWFIEVCRRVRLQKFTDQLVARTGNSEKERIAAKLLKGCVGDPWAPLHASESKSLTLNVEGDFDYARIVELLGDDWELPTLARLGHDEKSNVNWMLVLSAFARGNSKTGGFKTRQLPLKGNVARGLGAKRRELHQLATAQVNEVRTIDSVLKHALALASAGGNREKIKKDHYARARPTTARLDAVADRIFFPALWDRFEAEQAGDPAAHDAAREQFIGELADAAKTLLEEAIADIPCASIHRPRAEARARREFTQRMNRAFPFLQAAQHVDEEAPDAAA